MHDLTTAEAPRRGDVGRRCGKSRGNSVVYLLYRLQRDRPDIYLRYQAGEFRSAHSAAIVAGIMPPKTAKRS